jgi:hypothetical protein
MGELSDEAATVAKTGLSRETGAETTHSRAEVAVS